MAILTTLIVPPFLPALVRRATVPVREDADDGPVPGVEDDVSLESVGHSGRHDGHHHAG
jgi:hypothetical protein